MEILVWLFVGLMAFVAWLVFITYRIDSRNSAERWHNLKRQRELRHQQERLYWARAERDAARLRGAVARARQAPDGPEDGEG
jgi:hypothetical protein